MIMMMMRTKILVAFTLFLVGACSDKNEEAAISIREESGAVVLFKSGAQISGVSGIISVRSGRVWS